VGAVLALLLAAELLRGVRIGRRALLVAAVVTTAAVAANVVRMVDGADWLREQTVFTRSDLAAIEIAERTVPPDFQLWPEVAGTPSLAVVKAGPYLDLERDHGSPAYSEAELASAPEYGRRQADVVLAGALPLASCIAPPGTTECGSASAVRTRAAARSGAAQAARCTRIPSGGGETTLPPGSSVVELGAGPPAQLALRRFAVGEFPIALEQLPGGSSMAIDIPADRSSRPWRLRVEARQAATVCR
jgi:hypothetical protein